MSDRIPLAEEPIADMDAVIQYDRGAKLYMIPEYKYFAGKILKQGMRSGRILDIGTGSGLLAIELARTKNCNFEIIAVDISENMILKAKENARRAGVADRIKFMVGTASALPFADNSFDIVISYASLHHWFHPVKVLNEVARVTGEKGTAVIRDNKRVYTNPMWKVVIWLMTRFMNRRHRENWPKVLLASYTIPEVREMLSQSRLSNYRVKSDFVFIDLCIESRDRRG